MLHWTKEDNPHWDADKQAVFGPADLAAVGLHPPDDGSAVADEWWRVTDDSGAVLGYGWLDSEWGDAQITFVVAEAARGAGVGTFIVDHLEQAAHDRGVNYIYNMVPPSHPDRKWIISWLDTRGFHDSGEGELRRRVGAAM